MPTSVSCAVVGFVGFTVADVGVFVFGVFVFALRTASLDSISSGLIWTAFSPPGTGTAWWNLVLPSVR
jgi:hypothetical protein